MHGSVVAREPDGTIRDMLLIDNHFHNFIAVVSYFVLYESIYDNGYIQ